MSSLRWPVRWLGIYGCVFVGWGLHRLSRQLLSPLRGFLWCVFMSSSNRFWGNRNYLYLCKVYIVSSMDIHSLSEENLPVFAFVSISFSPFFRLRSPFKSMSKKLFFVRFWSFVILIRCRKSLFFEVFELFSLWQSMFCKKQEKNMKKVLAEWEKGSTFAPAKREGKARLWKRFSEVLWKSEASTRPAPRERR